MVMKIFAMVNKPYASVEGVFMSPNFSLAVRDNFQSWLNIYPNLLDDYVVYDIGSIERELDFGDDDSDIPDIDVRYFNPTPLDWSHFQDEMEYVPQKLSLHQQEVMRRGIDQQLGTLQQLQDHMERLSHLQKVNHPVGDIDEKPAGVAPSTAL